MVVDWANPLIEEASYPTLFMPRALLLRGGGLEQSVNRGVFLCIALYLCYVHFFFEVVDWSNPLIEEFLQTAQQSTTASTVSIYTL